MNDQLWSWLLTAVGLSCFWLAGRRVWWCWYIGLGGQVAWLAYSLITQQWGFLVGVAAYSIVYTRKPKGHRCPTSPAAPSASNPCDDTAAISPAQPAT